MLISGADSARCTSKASIKSRTIGGLLTLTLTLTLTLLALVGCDKPFSTPATISQAGGLPTLHYLNWGASYYEHALYSPNGHWIAVLAGSDFSKSHLEVLSPDGHTQYDLSGWDCGFWHFFDYAWLPDGRLSCIRGNEGVVMLCIGAYPFHSCTRSQIDSRIGLQGWGATWTADGAHVLLAAACDPLTGQSCLCVLRSDGTVAQMLPQDDLVYQPQLRPHTTQLSYILGTNLVLSAASWSRSQLALSTPQTIVPDQDPQASRYSWSPSGHWIAARADAPGHDRIYLINADYPEHTITVLDAVQTQEIMSDPVWSPDGKTLIVFSPKYNQPYAINIADYLHSKGLEV